MKARRGVSRLLAAHGKRSMSLSLSVRPLYAIEKCDTRRRIWNTDPMTWLPKAPFPDLTNSYCIFAIKRAVSHFEQMTGRSSKASITRERDSGWDDQTYSRYLAPLQRSPRYSVKKDAFEKLWLLRCMDEPAVSLRKLVTWQGNSTVLCRSL